MPIRLRVGAFALGLVLSCGAGSADPATLTTHMDGLHSKLSAGDALGLAPHFTKFALLLAPGSGRVIGQTTVERYYAAAFAGTVAGIDLTPQSIRSLGPDAASEWGDMRLQFRDGRIVEGHYLHVWQKEADGWVITESIFNTMSNAGS